MLGNCLRLAWLLGAIFSSFASPYGNIGCHFSTVCEESEECVDDNLFGSCVSPDSVVLPFYDVSQHGFRNLKIVIKLLLNRGYQWKDEAAQQTLETILGQYRQEYLDPRVELDQELQQEREMAELENLAQQYGGLFTERRPSITRLGDDIAPEYNPNEPNYFNQDKRDFLAENKAARGTSQDTFEDLIQEYVQEVENSPEEVVDQEVNWLYHEYYQKYLDLLEQYRAMEQEGGSEGIQEEESVKESPDYFADVQQKLDSLKQYLEDLYDGDMDEEKEEEEEKVEDAGEEGEVSQSQSSSWISQGSSSVSSISEGGLEEILEEGIDRLAVQLITNELIPQMTDEEQAQWGRLHDDEKESIIGEALGAISRVAMETQMEEEEEEIPIVEDLMGKEEEEVEEEVEEKMTEDLMADGDREIEEEIESPLFQPEETNEGDKRAQLFPVFDKKDDQGDKEENLPVTVGYQQDEDKEPPKERKRTEDPYSGFVFITFAETIDDVKVADDIINNLEFELGFPKGVFSDVKVNKKQITVHVNGSQVEETPTIIADRIAREKGFLVATNGVWMEATGVGSGPVEVVSSGSSDNSALVILTVVLVACVVGILVAIVAVYCVRKRAHEKAKVTELKTEERSTNEASADYQDLCRQRMATKSDKPEPLTRVSSVAASDGAQPSPSSRSSTSSWSEEPVQSNMDISTGHVVLSYMEDHLKNKDRLSKEWEALCGYEADPCSQDAAKAPENMEKNRVKTALPYDHTRVKLTEATSANKSDYVNASAIMDIDPRAPAYISTQAPLASTLADFWQMVWEQGSVVIVNLTHVSETDINRCRYWPDEGSALYHFYEVHLVSEHVWCEDYLVRSFYLKNLETQETRTVTQFHFLTWPETGVPPSPKSLLEFRRKVNKSFRGRACPIVVHCSDGVGRTGTYCLLDLVLTRMLKGVKELDIAATLEHIRDQRPGMVQTQAQFEFALTAVVEEVNAILKALPQ